MLEASPHISIVYISSVEEGQIALWTSSEPHHKDHRGMYLEGIL